MAIGERSAWRGVQPAEVVIKLRTRWDSGLFLKDAAAGSTWEPISFPLRPPTARQASEALGSVQTWIHTWHRAGHFRVETDRVGGRLMGANDLPVRAWVDTRETLWQLLGVTQEAARFEALHQLTAERLPDLAEWVAGHPMTVLRLAPVWDRLLETVDWIATVAGPHTYLRQIDVPGVDTKFVERYRADLAPLLDLVVPAGRIDASQPASRFVQRYGLTRKPSYVRLRRLDGSPLLAGGGPAELGLRVADLVASPIRASRFIVVENETTYLALPPVPDAVAVLGEGYAVTRLAPVAWLAERWLDYWSDLDTHGMIMLNRMRAHFPQLTSLLMDQETLLAHEAHWDTEPTPSNTAAPQLTPAESALYRDLLENRFGPQVRLEQERIRFSVVACALSGRPNLPQQPSA